MSTSCALASRSKAVYSLSRLSKGAKQIHDVSRTSFCEIEDLEDAATRGLR